MTSMKKLLAILFFFIAIAPTSFASQSFTDAELFQLDEFPPNMNVIYASPDYVPAVQFNMHEDVPEVSRVQVLEKEKIRLLRKIDKLKNQGRVETVARAIIAFRKQSRIYQNDKNKKAIDEFFLELILFIHDKP